jgi:SHS2 domain-containing protein
MPAYKFLEGVVTADLAFEASGNDLSALFTNAAQAVLVSQADVKTIQPKITKKIILKNADVGQLLFDFLNEIIYIKDAEQLIFASVKAAVIKNEEYELVADLKGETIDIKKHKLGNDLKAVTMHKFDVSQTKTGWKCTVVIDI